MDDVKMTAKPLKHLTGKDKRALAAFYSVTLLCALYFASGILVTYPPESSEDAAMANGGSGYIVQVRGLQTYAEAERLAEVLRQNRRIQAVIEAIPADQSYLINAGPLAKLETAERLTNDLQNAGHKLIKILENCQPGSDCNRPQSSSQRK
jgi:hypothetical protein